MVTTDLAGGLLRMVVRTLPERQAEWGRAMRAELAGIADRGERWRFAAGCALALLGRPAGALAVGWWLVRAALLAAVVAFGWAIGALPLRIEALALVAGLVLGYALLRSRICFGPVAASRGARLATAGGILSVATEVMLQFHRLQVDPPSALPMNAMAGVEDPSRATPTWSRWPSCSAFS